MLFIVRYLVALRLVDNTFQCFVVTKLVQIAHEAFQVALRAKLTGPGGMRCHHYIRQTPQRTVFRQWFPRCHIQSPPLQTTGMISAVAAVSAGSSGSW